MKVRTDERQMDAAMGDGSFEDQLRRLLGAVRRNRRIGIIGFLLPLIIALLYWVVNPPVFQSRTVFEIGRFGVMPEHQLLAVSIDEPQTIQAKLMRGESLSGAAVKDVRIQDRVVEVVVEGRDPAATHQLARKLQGQILEDHDRIYKSRSEQQRSELKSLEEQADALRQQAKFSGDRAQALLQKNPDVGMMYSIERNRLLERLESLDARAERVRFFLSDLQMRPTHVLVEPGEGVRVGPRLGFCLTIGLVAGIALSLISVLFADIWARVKG